MKRSLFPVAACLALFAASANAVNTAWTNVASGNWNLATGWSNGVPGSADVAVFAAPTAGILTLTNAANVSSFTMGAGGNATFSIANGGSLSVNSGLGSVLVSGGGGGLSVSQTNRAAANVVQATSIGSRGILVNASVGTAYLTIASGTVWNPDLGTDSGGTRINIGGTVNNNGSMTLQGTLLSTNKGMTLGATTGSGFAEFILDGGTLLAPKIVRNTAGSASFEFRSGTLIASSTRNMTNSSLNASAPLEIKLGSTGSRVFDASNGDIVFDSTARLVDLTTSGSFIKIGKGMLFLGTNNTYTGSTIVSNGILKVGIADAIANSSLLDLEYVSGSSTGRFDLAGFNQRINSLAGNGFITNSSTTAATLMVSNTSSATFAGVISGSNALVKAGSGTLALSGQNIHFGGTVVSNGTLQLASGGSLASGVTVDGGTRLQVTNGSSTVGGALTNAGEVSVVDARATFGQQVVVMSGGSYTFRGATNVFNGGLVVASNGFLGGAGRVQSAVALTNAGTLSPGNSPGTMTVEGDLTLLGSSLLVLEIGAGGTNAGAYDFLDISGLFTKNGTVLVTNVGSYAFQAGNAFNFFDAGASNGVFSATLLPNLSSGLQWDTSVFESQGILSVMPIPEPGAAVLVAGSLLAAWWMRRRRA